MGVTRRIIFPALRILVWAVIAVALVQLAFGGGSPTQPDTEAPQDEPHADFTEPQIEVTTASITNTVEIAGTVVADAAVPAPAEQEGYILWFEVSDGAEVTEGDRLLVVQQEIPRDPVESTDEDGNITVTEQEPQVISSVVKAPASGIVDFKVLANQTVTIGDVVATVDPGTHSVIGSLTPEQQYRLIDAPSEGEVTVPNGPAPFTCSNLTTGTSSSADGGSTGPSNPDSVAPEGDAPGGTTVQASCSVPDDVTVFPGLTATLTITTGSVEDALVLPVTAVQGRFETGNVWLPADEGEPAEHEVSLGLTDGEVVQITDGLEAGDLVLEFIPIGDEEPIDPYARDQEMVG
ncbi:secretion protein HlyD [Ruania alba]|uniref:Multidrug resistance protein MdtA-like C-terminal permuted SH3 domain-containing protein n=1 Tax=Ruania alba TaxID=648782 RepID=A0A1H5CLH0_9MICO|nr:secretion protein HlyD [Ruania alba]SED67447.1 hypothetical protein SAMN04488554_0405 [Ruania alba]